MTAQSGLIVRRDKSTRGASFDHLVGGYPFIDNRSGEPLEIGGSGGHIGLVVPSVIRTALLYFMVAVAFVYLFYLVLH